MKKLFKITSKHLISGQEMNDQLIELFLGMKCLIKILNKDAHLNGNDYLLRRGVSTREILYEAGFEIVELRKKVKLYEKKFGRLDQ